MADTDLVARFISGAALLVSAGSAAVSVMSYRRSGHRISATLRTVVSTVDADHQVHRSLRLINAGQSMVQVVRFAYQFDKSSALYNLSSDSYAGPALPFNLDGMHQAEWLVPDERFRWLVGQVGWKPERVRSVVTLGSGKQVKTQTENLRDWLSVVDHPRDSASGVADRTFEWRATPAGRDGERETSG